jgi:hypothetical protein
MFGLGGIRYRIVGNKAAYAIISPDIVCKRPETSVGPDQNMTKFVKLNIHKGTKIITSTFIGYRYILKL